MDSKDSTISRFEVENVDKSSTGDNSTRLDVYEPQHHLTIRNALVMFVSDLCTGQKIYTLT